MWPVPPWPASPRHQSFSYPETLHLHSFFPPSSLSPMPAYPQWHKLTLSQHSSSFRPASSQVAVNMLFGMFVTFGSWHKGLVLVWGENRIVWLVLSTLHQLVEFSNDLSQSYQEIPRIEPRTSCMYWAMDFLYYKGNKEHLNMVAFWMHHKSMCDVFSDTAGKVSHVSNIQQL